jgi:hypothetical protein
MKKKNKYTYHIEMRSINKGEVEADSQEDAEAKSRHKVSQDHTHFITSIKVEKVPNKKHKKEKKE